MTIVTQEKDLVNYDLIKYVSVYTGTYKNDEGEPIEQDFYTLLAFDSNCEVGADSIEEAGAIQLGVFDTSRICNDVLNAMITSINNNKPIFRVPQPDGSLI